MPPFGLASLIAPHEPEDFLNEHWQLAPFVTHELNESIREIRDLPFLDSLEALLNSWPDPVQAHLPDVSDESSSITVTAPEARKLFQNRMGLLFNQVEKRSPLLVNALAALRTDLGLPRATLARCMVYATPDGKGTAAHFDQNVNFVLQLHRTKKWRVAPNDHVENPTERFTIGQPVDPELASYLETEMPAQMPEGAEEYVLSPGSMLFVPRGFWHSTEAEGDALALNFTFSQPTWVDLFTAALRSRLILSPEWRELADGVTSRDPSRRELAEFKFESLLSELITDLPEWQAGAILNATEGDFSESQ